MALTDILIGPVIALLNKWLGPLRRLWDKIIAAKDHLLNIGDATRKLSQSIKDEVDGWKTFKQNPRFKSRVISVPLAFEKTKELIEGIPASWRAIQDLFQQLRDKIAGAGDPKAEAEEFAADLESGEGIAGLLKRLPKLAKGLEKLFGFLALAVDALETIATTIDDLQTIVDEASRIRGELEDLDTLFLSQKNPRRTVQLKSGKSIKIRVGNLHS